MTVTDVNLSNDFTPQSYQYILCSLRQLGIYLATATLRVITSVALST